MFEAPHCSDHAIKSPIMHTVLCAAVVGFLHKKEIERRIG
jgi:hypothetical protein